MKKGSKGVGPIYPLSGSASMIRWMGCLYTIPVLSLTAQTKSQLMQNVFYLRVILMFLIFLVVYVDFDSRLVCLLQPFALVIDIRRQYPKNNRTMLIEQNSL